MPKTLPKGKKGRRRLLLIAGAAGIALLALATRRKKTPAGPLVQPPVPMHSSAPVPVIFPAIPGPVGPAGKRGKAGKRGQVGPPGHSGGGGGGGQPAPPPGHGGGHGGGGGGGGFDIENLQYKLVYIGGDPAHQVWVQWGGNAPLGQWSTVSDDQARQYGVPWGTPIGAGHYAGGPPGTEPGHVAHGGSARLVFITSAAKLDPMPVTTDGQDGFQHTMAPVRRAP